MDNIKVRFLFKMGFILLSFLLTLYFGFQQIEKDSTVNGPVIFSMEELGYNESKPIGSFIDKDMIDGKMYDFYYLYIKSDTEDFMKMYLYECESSDEASNLLKTILIQKKESQLKLSCTGNCYLGEITFEDAIKDWIALDDWNVAAGYSSFDYHNEASDITGWYDVVLSKGNYVLMLDVDSDIKMTEDAIKVLVSIFDRVEVFE